MAIKTYHYATFEDAQGRVLKLRHSAVELVDEFTEVVYVIICRNEARAVMLLPSLHWLDTGDLTEEEQVYFREFLRADLVWVWQTAANGGEPL